MSYPRFIGLVLAASLALVLACGRKEDPPPAAPPSPDVTAKPAPTPESAEGIDTLAGANTSTKTAAFTGSGTTYLKDVRVARHEGYDRVVFAFTGELPGYTVEYTTPPILSDGAGEPVQVAGRHFVQVRLNPASGVDLSEPELREVYTGPDRVTGGTAEVKEVVKTGDFEAYLTWAIGLEDRVDFRVNTLSDPSRLIVDFRNH